MLLKLFVQPCQGRAAIIPDQFLMTGLLQKQWVAFTRSWGKKKKKAQFLFNNTQLYSCQNIFFSLTLITTLLIWLCRLIFPFTWILLFTCIFFSLTNSMHHLCYVKCFHSSSVLKQKTFSKYYISLLAAPSQWQFYPCFFNPSELSEKLKQ